MKIGIYIGVYDPKVGGGFTFQESILNELACFINLKYDFFIYYYNDVPIKNVQDVQTNIKFVKLKQPRKPTLYKRIKNRLQQIYYTLDELKKKKINILHQQALKDKIELMWFTSHKYEYTEIPYIFTVLDLQFRLQPYFPEVSADGEWQSLEKFSRLVISRASFVLTGTERGKEEIINLLCIPPERIKLLPHPVPNFVSNKEIKSIDIEKKYSLPQDFLFYPAQFWPHKNHIKILEAIKYLKETHNIDINIVFCGADYGNLSYIKNKIQEFNLINNIYILGFVSRDELTALYKKAISLIYLTHFGTENLPPLEAFALGCPVIASDVPGAKEQLGDAAILINQFNEKEIANTIKEVIYNNELRKKLIKKGYERAKVYSTRDYLNDMFQIFDEFSEIRKCWSIND